MSKSVPRRTYLLFAHDDVEYHSYGYLFTPTSPLGERLAEVAAASVTEHEDANYYVWLYVMERVSSSPDQRSLKIACKALSADIPELEPDSKVGEFAPWERNSLSVIPCIPIEMYMDV